ncbi:MAG TPA: 30S ribosomal protein S6 [Anaeromyxobacteraceae bacterium]|nr:30S ribosomal protein S6 [Anaeromyxobacteraceae bacterium]
MPEAQKRLAREYETIYLLKPETPDDQVEEIKERLRGVVTREGGKVIRFTNQGKRKTAYTVAKQQKALFIHCLYLGKPGLVQEFERNLKMIDSVTRFPVGPAGQRGGSRRPRGRGRREGGSRRGRASSRGERALRGVRGRTERGGVSHGTS